ncbi:MAG: chemotaxis protein CheW [Oscillospiraceae bacterium]|nr:chemotaxis protein CheW [Oscillospiraceae bacterium]
MADQFKKYLTFQVGGQDFAISISEITEILSSCSDCVRVPEFPSYAKGIIHLRGNVVSIIDLCKRFGKDVPLSDECCVIVIRMDDSFHSLVGFAADRVNAVEDIAVEDINPAPVMIGCADYISGITKKDSRIILILDPFMLVGEGMRTAIEKLNEDK